MRRELKENPIDTSGNGSSLRSFQFELADLPMMIHAMRIATTTAMMCSSPQAGERLRYYERMFKEQAPKGWEHLKREEDLSEIAIAMVQNPTWSISYDKKRWNDDGDVLIQVGNQKWSNWSITPQQYDEIVECVTAIAPLNCERVEPSGDAAA